MKRIVITDRDNKIIEFLKLFKCASTSTIATIFFNGSIRPCSRRLQYLRENGFIKSSQEYVSLEQIHYVNKKPTQLKHSCIVTKFISKLYENDIEILKCKPEFKIGNVRSDLMVVCRIDNKVFIYAIEVCNTKKFDTNKYIKLKESNKWSELLPKFPDIIAISDKTVNLDKRLSIKIINLDLSNFNIIKE